MYIHDSVILLLTFVVCKEILVVHMTLHKNQALCKPVAENNEKGSH